MSRKVSPAREYQRAFATALLLVEIEHELPPNQTRENCLTSRQKRLWCERERLYDYFFPGGMRARTMAARRFNILVAAAQAQQESPRHLNCRELAQSDRVRTVTKPQTEEYTQRLIAGTR